MKGHVCEAIEISKEVDSSSPELFKSICSLRYDKDMYSERKKIGTYTSDNPAVLNHIAQHCAFGSKSFVQDFMEGNNH